MKRQAVFLAAVFVLMLAIGLSVGLLLFSQPGPATAQPAPQAANVDDDYRTAIVEGIVWDIDAAVDPPIWRLDVFSIRVPASTAIITNGLSVAEGIYARIEFLKVPPLDKDLATGMVATSIELQNPPASALFDRIRTKDGETIWMVGNTQVQIDANTILPDQAEIGDLVFVEGVRSQAGIAATTIELASSVNQVLFDGAIQSISGNIWWVDDVEVIAPPPANVHGNVLIGSRVKVYGMQEGPRNVRAAEIWVMDYSGQHRLEGWLMGIIIGSDYPYLWQVNLLDDLDFRPIAVLVSADTVIDASQGAAIPRAWLEMEAIGESQSLYRADLIRVLNRAPKRQFFGVIEEMPANGYLGNWVISGRTVLFSQRTSISGPPAIGAGVWVSAEVSRNGVLNAEIIEVYP